MAAYGRLLGLNLIVLVAWLIVFGLLGWFTFASATAPARTSLDYVRLFFNLAGLLSLIGILGSAVGVVVSYAQREVVLRGQGPLEALGSGFGLVRARLGGSIVLWLISVALGIGGAIALVIALIIVALPAALVGGIFAFAASQGGGDGIPILVWIVVTLVTIAALVGVAVLNTLQWNFWTTGYLRLSRTAQPAPGSTEVS
jgi:hypothetical protein